MASTIMTTPLPVEAFLTNQDLDSIVKIVTETVKESEEWMTLKLTQSEERMTVKIDKLSNKIDMQTTMYSWVPFSTTLGSAFIAAVVKFLASKNLEDAIARFVGEKDTIKKELEENTQSKAATGTIAGGFLTLVLMASGAIIAHAVIHP